MNTTVQPHRHLGIALIACATTCLAVASVYSAQAVFGDIADKYGVSINDARLAFSVCSIAYALAFFVLGPLSDLMSGALSCSGTRVTRSSRRHSVVTTDKADLVVLADALVTDPRVLRDLHTARVPHLPVRVRDGTGLVGPLVIPGLTSCLACADLHRSDRDAAWPALAAQLRHAVTTADRATVLGTAALALTQVDLVIRALREDPDVEGAAPAPITLDTTVEFDVGTGSVVTRRWSRHPACAC